MVDPPRTGMAPSVFRALRAARGVRRVVYVSCNPNGYRLRNDFVLRGGSLAASAKVHPRRRSRSPPSSLSRVPSLALLCFLGLPYLLHNTPLDPTSSLSWGSTDRIGAIGAVAT